MSLVTGTGCILSCMTAAYLSVAAVPADAVLYATALLGIAGEIAEDACTVNEAAAEGSSCKNIRGFLGLGSFHTGLINALSLIDDCQFGKAARISRL
jgi:hydroxyethylthiazole kinase-like sugar kinase family protein